MPATDHVTQCEAVVRHYIDALGRRDTDTLVRLFTSDGEVISPLHGRLRAFEFFTELDRATSASDLTLIDVLASTTGQLTLAARFNYRWSLRNGSVAEFECCDLFDFVEPEDGSDPLIRLMTIQYDTAPLRGLL